MYVCVQALRFFGSPPIYVGGSALGTGGAGASGSKAAQKGNIYVQGSNMPFT